MHLFTLKTYVFLLAVVILGISCSVTNRYVYSPSLSNTTYFKEKGDSKLSASIISGGSTTESYNNKSLKNDGVDIQAGYSFSNEWAAIASFSLRNEADSNYQGYFIDGFPAEIKYRRNYFEVGIGNYELNKRKTQATNLFFGLGVGNFKINDNGIGNVGKYEYQYTGNYLKLFAQPSVNFIRGKYVRCALGGRVSLVYNYAHKTNYTDALYKYWGFGNLEKKAITYFEPNFNIQFGLPKYDYVKLALDWNFIIGNIGFPEDSRLGKRKNGSGFSLYIDPVGLLRKKKR